MTVCKEAKFWAIRVAAVPLVFFGNGMPELAIAGDSSSCHFHGSKQATEAVVLKCAAQRKSKLISQRKIGTEWANIAQSSIETVQGKAAQEWKVVFHNPKAKDRQKSTLYLFFTLQGNFIAANFTGK